MQLYRLLLAISFTIVFTGIVAIAADPKPPVELDWNEPIGKIGEFVADLSANRLEEAWQIYRLMLPDVPKTPQTPFEADPYESFVKSVGRFPTQIESFQMVATRNYTVRSRRMYFIADTKYGPFLVEMMCFRAKDQWYFAHFHYHSIAVADTNWHQQYEDVLPVTKLPEPLTVPLPKREPAAETAGK